MRIFNKVSFTFFALVFLAACDVPVGLGPRVNTKDPVIMLPSDPFGVSSPGSYLHGTDNTVYVDVKHEAGVDLESVVMNIEYQVGNTKITKTVPDAHWDPAKKCWAVNIDTIALELPDGRIEAFVTAKDTTNRVSKTTPIIYYVKNGPPQIEMIMPSVRGGTMANAGYPANQISDYDDPALNTLLQEDPIYSGFGITGMATDDAGIKQGYPKIQIWPSSLGFRPGEDPAIDLDVDGVPKEDAAGNPVNPAYAWQSVKVPIDQDNLTRTKFEFPMDSFAFGKYRFRIMSMDRFNTINIYPNRSDNLAGPTGERVAASLHPNKYMEINYIAADIPIFNLGDIPSPYNGNRDFEVKMIISSENPLSSVEAYIADNNTNKPDGIYCGPYTVYPVDPANQSNPYEYKLIVTKAEAASWPSIASGQLYVYFKAVDIIGRTSPPTSRQFIYDTTPPTVAFSQPVILINSVASGAYTNGAYEILYPSNPPKWVTGRITIRGTSNDAYNISKVEYHVGKLGDDKDPAGREALYKDDANWEDTRLDAFPPASGWSGSVWSWSYTNNFNNYKIIQAYLIQKTEELDWSHTNDELNFGTEGSNPDRFYLPFYVRVTDVAGNQKVIHYKLCIDPRLDDPEVTISNPKDNELVGGMVRLSGTASDNEWVHTVLVRIKKGTEAGYYIPAGVAAFYGSSEAAGYPTPGADTAGWFKANKVGNDMVVSWSCNINGDGGLNPTSGEVVDVFIEAFAIDAKPQINSQTPGKIGPITNHQLCFSSAIPVISHPEVTKTGVPLRTYSEGIMVSGKFTITTKIDDKAGFAFINARFGATASGPYTPLINIDGTVKTTLPDGWSISGPVINAALRKEYTLTINVDTTKSSGTTPGFAVIPGHGYGKTGNLLLDIEVGNSASPSVQARSSFVFAIDNFYPTADVQVVTSGIASGSSFLLQGAAKDYGDGSGTVQGLEKMLIYFEKAKINYSEPATFSGTRTVSGTGQWLDPSGNAMTFGPSDTWPEVRDAAFTGFNPATTPGPNVASLSNFPKLVQRSDGVWTSVHAMVVDNQENDPTKDSDTDGTKGEIWDGVADKAWGARLDTTKFDDGPLMVHYVIMDMSGNATHYQKDIYIENHQPQITKINFGTSLNGTATLKYRTNDYLVDTTSEGGSLIKFTPAFQIRNSRFSLKLTIANSTVKNGIKTVRVSYVTAKATHVSAAAIKRGHVYTIPTPANAGTTDWTKYGSPNNYAGTTFVALGAGQGTGKVIEYEEEAFAAKTLTTAASFIDEVIEFTNFSSVPDSPKNTSGDITSSNARLFIVKVYDQAVSGMGTPDPEYDQCACALMFAVDIDNTDAKAPTIDVAPFGRNYVSPDGDSRENNAHKTLKAVTAYAENVAAKDGEKLGYVQYGVHNGTAANADTAGTPDISGQVIFTGKAWDNQLIDEVYVTIDDYDGGSGTGSSFLAAKRSATTGELTKVTPSGAFANQWNFEVVADYDKLSMDYGHATNWKFTWDSSKRANGTAVVTFEVRDKNYGTPPNKTTAGTTSMHVNIVPYISEIVTPLSKAYASESSAFARSATGGYPVAEGSDIYIRGFNFGNAPTVTIGGGVLTVSKVASADTDHYKATVDTFKGTIADGSSLKSGALVVANGVASINNTTNVAKAFGDDNKTVTFTAPYNQEANGVNNDILDNHRYIYIWDVGTLFKQAAGHEFKHAFSRVDSKGNWFLSSADRGTTTNSQLRVRKNGVSQRNGTAPANGAGDYFVEQYANRFYYTTVAYDSNGDWYTAATNATSTANGHKFSVWAYENATSVHDRNILQANSFAQDRFQIPRLALNGTTVHMSYYDSQENELIYRYGNVTSAATNSASVANGAGTKLNNATYHGGIYNAVGTSSGAGAAYSGTYYYLDNHGLSAGSGNANIVLVGAASSTATPTKYYVTGVNTMDKDNLFAVNTASGSNGANLGESINVLRYIATPSGTGTSNSIVNTSRYYTFAAGHGFEVGDWVWIVYNNGTATRYYVVDIAANNIKFSTTTTPTATGNFFNTATTTANCGNVYVYPEKNATTATRSAIAAVGGVVVSWFDETRECLVFYNGTARRLVTAIKSNKGAHVDMVTDRAGGVHLAFYDVTSGGLYYACIENAALSFASDSDTLVTTIKKVDTYLNPGINLMISVREEGVGNYVPYISYAHGAFTNTTAAVRIAWRNTAMANLADGTLANDRFNGNWEVMTVPVEKAPTDGFICHGLPSSTANPSWTFSEGTANGVTTFTSTLLPANSKGSIVVMYPTNTTYEGAILKK